MPDSHGKGQGYAFRKAASISLLSHGDRDNTQYDDEYVFGRLVTQLKSILAFVLEPTIATRDKCFYRSTPTPTLTASSPTIPENLAFPANCL